MFRTWCSTSTSPHALILAQPPLIVRSISGPAALEFLHLLTPSDLQLLVPGQSTLSTFLHPVTAGIIDDLMITRLGPESFYLVTNAGCAAKDLAHISNSLAAFPAKSEVTHKVLSDRALLALQGPLAAGILSKVLLRATSKEPELHTLKFGHSRDVETSGFGTLNIVRGGYTGEDGFEIAVGADAAENFAIEVLEVGGSDTGLIGLGARDTLRLEAGLCLYGHDLDDSITPIEAGLKWVIGKSRVMTGGFNGAETLVRQYNDWKLVEKRRVGLVVQGSPAREGAEIHMDGEKVGQVTSGCPSPTLGWNIAMGYVKKGMHKAGTNLEVIVRGKSRMAEVVRMPFVDHRYFK